MVKVGSKVPDFSLKDKDGKEHKLSSVTSDYTVVYFYPKDDTPGCTIEATEFSRDIDAFKKFKTTIIGISGGDEKTKKNFCQKYDLRVLLLSDPDFQVSKAYDSYGEKKFMGRKYLGILRQTFVLDKDKKLLKVYEKVKAEGHSKEVLGFIKKGGKE